MSVLPGGGFINASGGQRDRVPLETPLRGAAKHEAWQHVNHYYYPNAGPEEHPLAGSGAKPRSHIIGFDTTLYPFRPLRRVLPIRPSYCREIRCDSIWDMKSMATPTTMRRLVPPK